MKIILDSNDASQAPWLLAQISGHPLLGIPEIKPLDCGDIWIVTEYDTILVERKTPNDLLHSIADGRLFNQCAEMRLESEWCYLLISGQQPWGLDGKIIGTQWNFRSVQGALLQCQELGVGVVHAQNDTDITNSLVWLATRRREQHIYIPARKYGHDALDEERVLMSLPGIGLERAQTLLKTYNLRDALLCLLDEKCKVEGIGEKTKQNIRQLFQLRDNEKMEVIND